MHECGRCVSIGERGLLSISMHLLQIVSIYLFIFPRREKKCENVCVFVYSKKPILSLDSHLR